MKPKRKVSPRSFVMKVAGAGGPSGGGLGGQPKGVSDHDLVHPAAGGGAVPGNDPDRGPAGGGGR